MDDGGWIMTRAIVGTLLTLALAGPWAGPSQASEVPATFVETPCIGDFSRLPNQVECRLLIVPETRGRSLEQIETLWKH